MATTRSPPAAKRRGRDHDREPEREPRASPGATLRRAGGGDRGARASLRAAAAGHGQLFTIAGEAGIGKTRTLEEFFARTRVPEARVLWGRCPEAEGVPACWPWAQALRVHVERSDTASLRAALGPVKVSGLVAAVAMSLVVFSAQRSDAKCDPTGADAADVAAARAAVAANCDCAGAANHGQYVSCAAAQAKATLANQSCKGAVQKCAAKSTCGKPGFVTCCRTKASGVTKCSTKSSAERCKAPKGGSACVSTFASCCDACTESGCAGSPSGAFVDGSF